MVIHSDKPRGFWQLGRVLETITGHDGEVRGALIKVYTKRGSSLLRRPVQLLYPLEISCQESASNIREQSLEEPMCEEGSPTPEEIQPLRRPRRAAAFEARDRIIAHTFDQ